jgi:hypothetical protein
VKLPGVGLHIARRTAERMRFSMGSREKTRAMTVPPSFLRI